MQRYLPMRFFLHSPLKLSHLSFTTFDAALALKVMKLLSNVNAKKSSSSLKRNAVEMETTKNARNVSKVSFVFCPSFIPAEGVQNGLRSHEKS